MNKEEERNYLRFFEHISAGDGLAVTRMMNWLIVDKDWVNPVTGRNAVSEAFHNNHIMMVELLIKKGFSYRQCDARGNTILHIACRDNKHRMVCTMLMDNLTADLLSVLNVNGHTPLFLASAYKNSLCAAHVTDREIDDIGICKNFSSSSPSKEILNMISIWEQRMEQKRKTPKPPFVFF
jgi:hypothetical protein